MQDRRSWVLGVLIALAVTAALDIWFFGPDFIDRFGSGFSARQGEKVRVYP